MKSIKILAFLLIAFQLNSQDPGSQDFTFGELGFIDFFDQENEMRILHLNDGKYITCVRDRDFNRYELVRYFNDGQPDGAFGNQSVSYINSSTSSTLLLIQDFQVDKEGNLYILSIINVDSSIPLRYELIKLNANGSVVSSFADGGSFVEYEATSCQLKIDENNNLFVFGSISFGSFGFINKILSVGVVDVAFGDIGYKILNIPFSGSYLSDIEILDDQSIIAAGATKLPGEDYKFTHFKFDEFGNEDLAFGDFGLIEYPNLAALGQTGIEKFSGNQLLSMTYDSLEFNLLKINYDGQLDNSWGDNGILSVNMTTLFNVNPLNPLKISRLNIQTREDNSMIISGELDVSFPTVELYADLIINIPQAGIANTDEEGVWTYSFAGFSGSGSRSTCVYDTDIFENSMLVALKDESPQINLIKVRLFKLFLDDLEVSNTNIILYEDEAIIVNTVVADHLLLHKSVNNFQITDYLGRRIISSSESTNHIDVSSLKTGQYYLTSMTEGKSKITEKFIKVR